MSLFRNPERWATQAAGSTGRLVLMMSLHFVLCALLMMWILIPYGIESPTPPSETLRRVAAPLLFVGFFYPGMYLYAMSRLLKRIDDLEKRQP